jgi:hypothetical protein
MEPTDNFRFRVRARLFKSFGPGVRRKHPQTLSIIYDDLMTTYKQGEISTLVFKDEWQVCPQNGSRQATVIQSSGVQISGACLASGMRLNSSKVLSCYGQTDVDQ